MIFLRQFIFILFYLTLIFLVILEMIVHSPERSWVLIHFMNKFYIL